MESRIKKVMGDVFNIGVDSINNDCSPDNIENWDSLKHMNMVVALEEEFQIEFTDDEINKMLNYSSIKNNTSGKI